MSEAVILYQLLIYQLITKLRCGKLGRTGTANAKPGVFTVQRPSYFKYLTYVHFSRRCDASFPQRSDHSIFKFLNGRVKSYHDAVFGEVLHRFFGKHHAFPRGDNCLFALQALADKALVLKKTFVTVFNNNLRKQPLLLERQKNVRIDKAVAKKLCKDNADGSFSRCGHPD